ncbi:hypothetical protein KCP71_12205 [Salmonella enterica subsp. enterica]|nr:hypothetical protein KCP71_12205 [Salmonella enterica subsp. enterica]
MIAVVIGSLTSFLGAWLSYWLDGATGGDYCRHANLTVHHSLYFSPETRSLLMTVDAPACRRSRHV